MDEDEVGAFPFFDGAGDVVHAQGFRSFEGCHAEGGGGVEGFGLVIGAFCQQGSEAHFFHHVEAVVAGCAVGPDAYGDACRPAGGDAGYAAG